MPLAIQVTQKSIRQTIAGLKRKRALIDANGQRALQQIGQKWQGDMQDRLRGNPLKSRTGALRRSLRYGVSGSSHTDYTLRIVSTSPYAKIHEFGGPIVPKRAKSLTIPMRDNLTSTGRTRFPSARELFNRDPTVFILRGPGLGSSGPAYIVRRKSPTDLEFLFRLVKRVTIPARLGFFATWHGLARWRDQRIARALRLAVRGERLP